jgi:ferredoxin
MIEIKGKKECCGCHACVTVCAKHCITMQPDEEGFLYPVVDKDACTDCGLCEKVCPVINQSEPRKPLKVYAAKNKNEEIRYQSSSGGIFTLLA